MIDTRLANIVEICTLRERERYVSHSYQKYEGHDCDLQRNEHKTCHVVYIFEEQNRDLSDLHLSRKLIYEFVEHIRIL